MRAETYYFKQYQVQDGLSNNIVNCSLQDSHGFMWFGTRDGLNRFDGYTFRVFRDVFEQSEPVGSSNIQDIAMDKKGNLWVGTYNGLYKYDEHAESFELVLFSSNMRASNLIFSAKDDLWLILNGRLVKYNEQLDSYQTYAIPDNASITSFCLSPMEAIWITFSNGMLYKFNDESGDFTGYDLFAHSANYSLKRLTKVYSTEAGNKLFVGTLTQGAKMFDIQSGTYIDIQSEEVEKYDISIRDFIQVSPDVIWIGTEIGLYIYHISTDTYTSVKKRPYDPYSLSTNILSTFCRDKEKGLWIGTYSGGVNYYSDFNAFEKYYAYPGDNNTIQGELVHDICTDQYDNLWIATEDAGLNKLDSKTGKFKFFRPQQDKSSISRINIQGLVIDGDKLWVGSLTGVDLMDVVTERVVKHYQLGETSTVVVMKKLPNGMLLVGTSNGMYIFNKASEHFDFLPIFPANHRIQSIFEDHAGVIWVGMVDNGVFFYNPTDESSGYFEPDSFVTTSQKTINDIFEDDEHNLWFTSLGGVKKYDRATATFTNYTTANGMPANTTFRILTDETKKMWISTSKGLVCLDPKTGEIRTYTHEHGIIIDQFNYNSAWKDKYGQMYFGMVKGMIRFKPDELKVYEDNIHVFLTSMTILDKKGQTSFPVSFKDKIVLSSDQSTFKIEFSALSYFAPTITEYAFCMEGLTNTWTYTKGYSSAYYTKLAPGNYTFKIQGANISGIWNEHPTILKITIQPPWWSSLLAKSIYGLIFVGICIGCFNFINQQNKKKTVHRMKTFENEKEKELYQAKINFFINIAHEIRTPLTLIKSPLEKVMKSQDMPAEAQGYLTIVNKNANRLLELANQLLDFRKTELKGYSLNFVKTDVIWLIQDICERFKDTVEENNLSFEIKIDAVYQYAYVDEEACTKIITNLLSNAFKYAQTSIFLSLSFQEKDGWFILEVGNDGETVADDIKEKIFEPFFRGENAEHKPGTGLGLPLAKSLSEMHKGSLTLVSTEPFTIFRLCLPVNQPYSIQLSEDESPVVVTQQLEVNIIDRSRPTILIVEDNREMRTFVSKESTVLYNSIIAYNGKEALEALKQYSVQLIVSDIMMPVMDGISLLKVVKHTLEYSHIPVILLTAKNTIQSRLEGLELGADAYIEKPFSIDLLLAQIANLLANRENIRTSYSHSPIAHMKSMAYTKADENFLDRLNDIIIAHISNINFDVDMIADLMNLSRPTLYRKISALSNLSPNELIRIARLKKAVELIDQNKLRIYEISEAVGFKSQSYFSRSFIKQFGMSPSQYAKDRNR
ncbi:hybrid sensor histidine kinase/response regulator [Bacteroidia bacterium]|nr:hybrid sensor histidine kinase/response regulator [Bacteroidia bacterium]